MQTHCTYVTILNSRENEYVCKHAGRLDPDYLYYPQIHLKSQFLTYTVTL